MVQPPRPKGYGIGAINFHQNAVGPWGRGEDNVCPFPHCRSMLPLVPSTSLPTLTGFMVYHPQTVKFGGVPATYK